MVRFIGNSDNIFAFKMKILIDTLERVRQYETLMNLSAVCAAKADFDVFGGKFLWMQPQELVPTVFVLHENSCPPLPLYSLVSHTFILKVYYPLRLS